MVTRTIATRKRRYLSEAQQPEISTRLLHYHFDAPFGVAPMGLSSLIWPDLERILAAAARAHNIPYVLSTYACISLERLKPIAGDNGWFQYYPSNDPAVEADLLGRCKAAGYQTLVLTVDIPYEIRREREIRHGLSVPPRLDFHTLRHMLVRPRWALQMLRTGIPEFETLKPYYPAGRSIAASVQFIAKSMKGHITAERFKSIRAAWGGDILVKGILDADEATHYMALGADGIIVSNHGGRQFDAAPTPVAVLPKIRAALGNDVPILADGGIRTGLDIARMLALGANFVFLGRPFAYAVAAMGRQGGDHVIKVLEAELRSAMAQMGCPTLDQLPNFLLKADVDTISD